MLKLIIINLLFLNIAQAIDPVAAGANIEAAKINSIIDGVNKVSDKVYDVGDVRSSMLSESVFQSRNGTCWVLMKGQNVAGSLYAQVSGSNVLPDMTTEGTFLRQAKSGRALGSYEADDNKAHRHNTTLDGLVSTGRSFQSQIGLTTYNTADGGYEGYYSRGASGTTEANASLSSTSGGGESRPKNTAVNMFIKINNCN